MIRVNFVTRDYIDGLENYYINALGRNRKTFVFRSIR